MPSPQKEKIMLFKELRQKITARFIDASVFDAEVDLFNQGVAYRQISAYPKEKYYSFNTSSEALDLLEVQSIDCKDNHIHVNLLDVHGMPTPKSYAKTKREKKVFNELIDELRFNLKMIVKYHTMMKNEGGFIERLFNIEWNSFIKVELIYDLLSRGFNIPTRDWWKNVYEYIHS